ncbi:MAG: acyl-CoA/acyl-ACP dehydrogenase [Actinobacteria bacterium]|nr:acyl-CoA/acyl-ACP dehydrogenase [Actinomycetota bacterium]
MQATVSEDLELIGRTCREFADRELVEGREERDRYPFGPPFERTLEKAFEVGLFSIMLPEEAGGSPDPVGTLCVILDEICRVDASLGGIVFTVALAQELIHQAGEPKAIKERTSSGGGCEQLLTAFPSFTDRCEIERSTALRAVGANGDHRLEGLAEYVVLGGMARRALLPARIDGGDGWSLFMVDAGGDAVRAGKPVLSLGMHACPAVDLELAGAPGRLIGEAGRGAGYLEAAADRLFVAIGAMASGVMKGSFDTAFDYAKERVQGGREIVGWSEVKMLLADMALKVKLADMLVGEAARAVDRGAGGWTLASRAAGVCVPEMARDVTSNGVQLLGGNGYMKDYGQEKRFRDARQLQTLLGSSAMNRLAYIEKVVGGEPAC